MATTSFDTRHEDMIHDCQVNYYGKRLATASSDRTIKIWEIGADNSVTLSAELRGHDGPVWQVSWAHPKFGNILASCSYDRKVIIWKEMNKNDWQVSFEYTGHELSVNSISWAPHEFGLILACASSDSSITILTQKGETFAEEKIFTAHQIGVNAVSWAPAISPDSILKSGPPTPPVKRIASAGCDNLVKIWRFIETDNKFRLEGHPLQGHTDWVRDVAWAPNIGLPSTTIASCSQDGSVIIWTQDVPAGPFRKEEIFKKSGEIIWRVSWSITGNILAVSGGDNKVTLWKQALDGKWNCISAIDEAGQLRDQ